ncbi:zinc finger protein3-like [Moniliophthora roreri]|uniref:Uncharacterized protein n=1 Tax=Moniliophthora roreri TaxID=221103 RepID=A0A0W0FEP4_MONRR|nr:zinc finger protein3-like [Moniliophthora roreri]
MSRQRQHRSDIQGGTESQVLVSLSPIPTHIYDFQPRYGPSYPVSVAEDATGALSLESRDVGTSYVDSERANGTRTSFPGWINRLDVASEPEYSQTLPGGYDSISSSESQSFGPVNAIPGSSRIQSDANAESPSTYSPLPHNFYDIYSITPAVSTSPDSSSWYSATPPHSDATSDSAESALDPSVTTPRSFKPIVASGNVLDASIQRRKDQKLDGKYKCTGFGACKATFTAGHNLKSTLFPSQTFHKPHI